VDGDQKLRVQSLTDPESCGLNNLVEHGFTLFQQFLLLRLGKNAEKS
jgi:hypothetical protein